MGADESGMTAAAASDQKSERDEMTSMSTVIVEADLTRPDHQQAVLALTAAYALDEMGNGGALGEDVLARLIPALRAQPTTLVFLALAGGSAVGIATCFGSFSTFAARPVINVHDLFVIDSHRGCGIGRTLLAAVEEAACRRGCAKVTLEVLENNSSARRLYESVGFAQAVSNAEGGGALFYAKRLGEVEARLPRGSGNAPGSHEPISSGRCLPASGATGA